MKLTCMTARTPEEAIAQGAKLVISSIDCEICESQFVPHLLLLQDGDHIGLCNEHLGEYPRLWLESGR